ncbi:MAG: filamentous hemagglutinin N-terminal domain-containing protein [Gammaproteobacteria bacterium]|nr:filamentous hemagglutinin N-terminal domain-containing protein [Gammaproteobacteria bacterium]
MNKKHTPLKRVTRRRVNFAFTALCCLSISGTPQAAPQGGQVSAGSGSIQASGNITQINQNSQQLVIDWNSFNVGVNESVNFLQPNSNAAVLNRIHDQNPSQIFGNINANGRVFLSNPNGMIFGANSQVNVGSLFATTLGINNDTFMSGRYNFSAVSDGGTIVNHGLLNAATGGSVSLVADAVDNQGEIIAHYGYINLASGRTAAIDFDGDGFIHFEIDGEVLGNATGKTTGVNNSGIIRAHGGEVLLTARHAQDVFERAINNDGLIEAGRMLNEGGVIRLVGIGGDVVHSGVIDASGQDQASTGGDVQVLGDRVGLFEAAVIDVSGSSGGGNVLVGGDFQGTNAAIHNARQTLVSRDSRIIADAQQSGEGGRVIVWADGYTRFLGSISAQGGALSGNGGFVEVSGKQQLGFAGQVDTSAANGLMGQLLLDPTNIIVSSAGTDDYDNVNDFLDVVCTDCTISAATLVAVGANITLQANNDITFSENLILGADHSLLAEARNDIVVDTNIMLATQGTGTITLTADADVSNVGAVTMMADSVLQTTGGNVTISAAENIDLAEINAGSGTATVTTTAGNIISSDSSIIAGTLNLSAINGSIGTSSKNIGTTVTTLNADTSMGGDIYVTETDAINLAVINAGTGEINISATDINGNGISMLTAASLTLDASAGGIGASGNKINTTTTGAISLTTGGAAGTGDIYIVESNSLNTSDIALTTLTGDTTPANNIQTVDITADSLSLNANFGNTNDHLLLTASSGGISGNATLSSNDLMLTADTAGQAVGSSGILINTTISGNLTASASNGTGGIYLSNTDALSITSINAGTGDISISATDINGNGISTLTAASLTLDASAGGIGSAGNKINTTTTGTISLTTGGTAGAGDIYIVESNSLNTSDITLNTLTGDITPANNIQTVDITADSLNLDANFGNTNDHLLLTASSGGISGNATLSSNDLTLTADTAGQAIGGSGTPINTAISGNLTASASNGTGGIYLSNTGALSIASINADTGNVELTASGVITESVANTTVDVTAASLSILDAAGVGASTANGALDLAVDNLNIAQATPGAIYLTGSGDIALGVINGTGQTVSLAAAGNITDNGSDIMANDLTLIATGNGSAIGATGAANVINTTVTGNLTAAASTGNGGIYLSNTGALAVASVDAGAGAVELTATGAITDATLDAGVDISGTAIALTATSIGAGTTTANALNINGTTLAVSSPGGAIYVTEADNIGLGVINGSGQTVYLNAAGNITDNSSSVQAANLILIATGNGSAIGATGAANVINTTVTGNLTAAASSGNGGIYLSNTGALAVVSVDAGTGAVELTATGAITDATLDAGVDVSGTAIALTAASIGVGATAANALNINGTTLAVSSPGGAIYVTEADNIGLGVINGSGQTVYLNAAGNITDSSSLVSADTLFLEVSTDSSVGSSSASINTDLSGVLTVTATGSGGIYINEADSSTADGLSLATINAGSGDVDIMSVGSIFGAGSSITGDTLTIASTSGSVGGSATDPVNTTVTTLNATASTGVFIADSSALSLANISAGSGDINISATSTLDINTTGSSPGVLTLNSVGSQNYTASTINLYDNLATSNSGITLDGDVMLFNPVSLDTNTGVGDVVITGEVNSDNFSTDSLSILAGSGNINLMGELGRLSGLSGLSATTNGELFLNGNITTNAANISLAATQITLETNVVMSTGTGVGNISLNGNVDPAGSTSRLLSLQSGNGNIDISNAIIGSSTPLSIFSARGNVLALGNVTTNSFQEYTATGTSTINGDITLTSGSGNIDFRSSISGSGSDTLSINADIGSIFVEGGITGLRDLNLSAAFINFAVPASVFASDSINITLPFSSLVSLSTMGATGLSNNTALLSVSTPGSIDVDGVTISSALSLNATGGSGSQVIFSADSTFTGNLTVLADDGIEVNARIETTSTGADINLNSDANNTAESNDNIVFSAANIVSGGSLIMSATNGGIELEGGATTATGTTTLSVPNGGLDISGISVDGQSNASLIYILDIITNNDVLLGDIGQTNLIDSLSVTTANNDVYLYGDISTRRSGGIDLGSDITTVILEDDVSIDTTTGNGSVSLANVEGAYSLNIDSGNGNILLAGVGQNTALTALTITNQGTTALTGNITTSAIGGVDFSGARDIDITGDISLTARNGGTINLAGGTVDGDAGLVLVSSGTTRVGGALNLINGELDLRNASNIVVDNDFTLTSTSATLGGSITTSTGVGSVDLSGAGAIVLNNNLLLDTSASDAAIDISSVDITGNSSLSLVSGAGDITLNNITDLTSISISGSGLTTLAGNLTTTGTGGVDLGNASNILLGTNVSIDTTTNSGRIDLTGGGIEGPNSLTIITNEGAILLGDMGQSVALSALTINSTGVTTFDNAVISTQGSGINLTAATDVNITGDVVFNSSSGSGAIYLDGDAVDGAGGLTVNVNRGDLFLGAVGQDVPLAYLTLSGDGLNQIAGNISTLGNVDFSAANIDSIDPAIDLLINAGSGDVSLAETGATVPFLSLTIVTDGSVNLSDNITTQGTGIDFTGAGSVILSDGSDITIDTSQADDGAILLNSGLSIDGNGSLNLLANLGAIELGNIGQTTAIAALTTSSNGATTLAGAVTSTGDININTGSIAQNGNITSTAGSLAIISTADIVMAETVMSTTSNQPVNYTSTTGDIYVAQIDAGNGAVTLDALQGNVYSSLGDNINLALSQPNITASTATINSGGAIGRSSASGITIDATSSIQLTFGAEIAYINNVQGVPVRSSGRVIDVLADRKAMAAVGHSGGLEADALAQTAGDFAILPQEQSLFLIAGPNNQFAAQYDDAEVISIINPDVPTLLHTKDAWIFKRPEEKDEKDKRRGASWF